MYDDPSVVVIVVVVFIFCFYFIASNERGKIYIQKLNKYKYVQVQLYLYAKKREEKSQLMHELNGTERRQLRHFTWPDLWQIIQFIVKAQCLICEMTHRICFSFHCFCVCAFDSTIHSFVCPFVCLPFQLTVWVSFQTKAYTLYAQLFVGILFSNRYTTQ